MVRMFSLKYSKIFIKPLVSHKTKYCINLNKAFLSCYSCQSQSCMFPEEKKKFNFLQKRSITDVQHLPEVSTLPPQSINSGIFRAISESAPVEFLQTSLIEFHLYTGLPWWGTIMFGTIILRSLTTLPLAIYQQYILAKLELLKYEMNDIVKELKKETSAAVKMFGWEEKYARRVYNKSLKSQWNKLVVRENCHPFKTTLLLWVQIPLWVSLSMSIRNLIYMLPKQDLSSHIIYNQLCSEGFGWIPNLTEIDASLVLPIAFGLINLSLIELMTMSKVTVPTRFQKIAMNLFRGFTIILIPICASVPSGLVLYWTTSSIFGLVQNIVLMSPKVKRFCRIPLAPSELDHPYKQLSIAIKNRLSFSVRNNKKI